MSSETQYPVKFYRRLPEADGTATAIAALSTWWPAYFKTDHIAMYPRMYSRSRDYFIREEILSRGLPLTDEAVAPATHLNSIFVQDTDFIQVPKTVVFTNPAHLSAWLVTRMKALTTTLTIPDRIEPTTALPFSEDPYPYHDVYTGRIYLIQNVRGGEYARALNVCLQWLQHGINVGHASPPSTQDPKDTPYIIYSISRDQTLVPVHLGAKGQAWSLQLLRYTADWYAAILPLSPDV